MIKLLKKCHLNITIQTNVKIANFLEVEINLDTDAYQLYRKPDSIPVYINRKSNHHPTTIKKFSKAIAKRIPDILMSQSQYIQMYSEKMFFHDKITFITKITNIKTNKKKSHKRKIFWFNPPYYLSDKTNGKIFLKIIKRFFSQK